MVQCRRHKFNPWVGKIPWKKKWRPTPVFLTGKSHGQPRGHNRVRHNLATKQQQTTTKDRLKFYPLAAPVNVILSDKGFLQMRAVLCLVVQACPTLCDPTDCSSPGSSVHGDSPGKNTGVGCHAFLQEIFPTQGSNTGLPHCRWILYVWTILQV